MLTSMTPASTIRTALAQANVQAFSRLIREKEANQNDTAYTLLNGGAHFPAPPWVHPYHGRTTTEVGHSTAAGAGQFLGTTWGRLTDMYPEDCFDFSPPCQEFGIVALIAGRGALQDVLNGNILAAIIKCRQEWTSLPGASESRSSWTMEKALACYQGYGGTVTIPNAAPTPAQQQETSMAGTDILGTMAGIAGMVNPGAGLGLGLLNSLIKGFAPLAQEKVTKELARHTDQATASTLVNTIIGLVQEATGKVDPVEAVVAAKSDPAIMAHVEQQTLLEVDKLAPLLDKINQYEQAEFDRGEASMSAAGQRQHDSPQNAQLALFLTRSVVTMVLLVGAGLTVTLGLQLYYADDHKPDPTLITLLAGLVGAVIGNWGQVFNFIFGSSPQSKAKDTTIAELAARRPAIPANGTSTVR